MGEVCSNSEPIVLGEFGGIYRKITERSVGAWEVTWWAGVQNKPENFVEPVSKKLLKAFLPASSSSQSRFSGGGVIGIFFHFPVARKSLVVKTI